MPHFVWSVHPTFLETFQKRYIHVVYAYTLTVAARMLARPNNPIQINTSRVKRSFVVYVIVACELRHKFRALQKH